MAEKTVLQNPSNKVGRNSGAGPGGLDDVVPSEAEARRGLEPLHAGAAATGWKRTLGLGLGAVAAIGGLAALALRRVRQPKDWKARVRDAVKR